MDVLQNEILSWWSKLLWLSLTFAAYLNGYKAKHFGLKRLYEIIPAFASPKIEQLNLKQF